MWLGGVAETTSPYDDCPLTPTGNGLPALSEFLGVRRAVWNRRKPIYDEAKVAENAARIAEKRTNRPPMVWDMVNATRDDRLRLEREIISGRKGE
jgi:hypothetical protein